jgi:hypothetical protein
MRTFRPIRGTRARRTVPASAAPRTLPALTPLFSDDFTPNANPLNPAQWATASDGWGACQALDGQAHAAADGGIGLSVFVGAALPVNQYAQFTVAVIPTGNGTIGVGLLVDATGNLGHLFLLYLDGGVPTIAIFEDYGFGGLPLFTMPVTVNVGDQFTVAMLDGTLYVEQNGVLLWSGPPAVTHTSGSVAVAVFSDTVVADSALSNFVAGSVAAAPVVVTSIRLQILRAIETALNATGKPSDVTIYFDRIRPIEKESLPAIFIDLVRDTMPKPLAGQVYGAPLSEFDMQVILECRAQGALDVGPETALDPLYVWCVKAMKADEKFGGLANGVQQQGTERFSREGEIPVAAMGVHFAVKYRTATGDPTKKDPLL